MPASYPSSVKTFTTKVDGAGNTIFAGHVNDLQDEVTAIEGALLNGVAHSFLPSTDAARALGAAAFRFTDAFLSSSARIGTTPATTGLVRLANNDGIAWRDAGNTTNLLLRVDSSDRYEFSGGAIIPSSDAVLSIGVSGRRWTDLWLSGVIRIGTNPATAGAARLANASQFVWRNAANGADIVGLDVTASDRVRIAGGGNDIQWGVALVALGGGAAPTLGTIGGSGPATAAQNTWMRVVDSAGAAFWVPVWK